MDQYHHQRIDKGVERGPRNKHRPPAKKGETGHPSIPEGLDPQAVLDRYLTESTTSQIAQEFGISRKTLIRWIRDVAPDQWKKVQVVRALCRKDDGDEGIEAACDALSLARAREQLKSGQWDLERLDRQNYGVKQEVTHTLKPEFNVILKPQERVIEGENVGNSGDKQVLENHSSVMSTKSFLPKE